MHLLDGRRFLYLFNRICHCGLFLGLPGVILAAGSTSGTGGFAAIALSGLFLAALIFLGLIFLGLLAFGLLAFCLLAFCLFVFLALSDACRLFRTRLQTTLRIGVCSAVHFLRIGRRRTQIVRLPRRLWQGCGCNRRKAQRAAAQQFRFRERPFHHGKFLLLSLPAFGWKEIE
ncbi:MAG: hypothetical protein KDJ80_03310 [Nitratireductor sp.]|nr:hypothetical protein [Nitratireductor sp.]